MRVIPHQSADCDSIRAFVDAYHPLGAGGALKGLIVALWGYERDDDLLPAFLAVFVHPRARWRKLDVRLELSRLVIAPYAQRSASTFLRACMRYLRRERFGGFAVTYVLPGASGLLYERAGWQRYGQSSGASWARRGPGERATRRTVGDGKRLVRYIYNIDS